MCYIIYNKNNQKFNFKNLEEAFLLNHHGIGILYKENNSINTIKLFNDVLCENNIDALKTWFQEAFLPIILKINNNSKITDVAIHFRRGTNISINNVHPFNINDDIYIMHNGSFNIELDKYSGENDTYLVAKMLRKEFMLNGAQNLDELFVSDSFKSINKNVIGHSRCLFYTKDKVYVRTNDKEHNKWTKDGNIWQSASDVRLLYGYENE